MVLLVALLTSAVGKLATAGTTIICVWFLSSMLGVLCKHYHSFVLSSYPVHVCVLESVRLMHPCNEGRFSKKKGGARRISGARRIPIPRWQTWAR
jgi:hypothetical protein